MFQQSKQIPNHITRNSMALTLEQVLARALRLPSKRINKTLFQPTKSATSGGGSSHSDPKQMLELMRRIEIADDLRTKNHLKISSKCHPRTESTNDDVGALFIRNNQDLLSHLNAAKRLGAWEDALSLFQEGQRLSTITPNVAHLRVVADTLCTAQKTQLLVDILNQSTNEATEDLQSVLVHATRVLCKLSGWEAGLQMVQRARPSVQSADAFNECTAMCASLGNWEGCLRIVTAMGPSILNHHNTNGETTSIQGASPPSASPSPDAVSFAALVSVLQETNQQEKAKDILLKLPAGMRETILTSTVALIHVWSEQRSKRRGPPGQ